jgi:hypothetical protein
MATPTSLSAGFAMGAQLIKGTAATDYVTGLMSQSGIFPRPDQMDITNEHGGTSGRATVRKARSVRMGYIEDFSGQFRLYPSMIGHALRMAGFKCTTTATQNVTVAAAVQTMTVTATGGTYRLTFDDQTTAAINHNANAATIQAALETLSNVEAGDIVVAGAGPYTFTFAQAYANKTPPIITIDTSALTGGTATMAYTTKAAADYYVHVFKLTKRANAGYGSVLSAIDEGASAWERKATDCRLNNLSIAATLESIMVDFAGLGLTEAAAAGSETKVAETGTPLSQATGTFSILTDAAQLHGVPGEHTFTIAQQLAEDDKKLHSASRADIPIQSIDITGQLRRVDANYTAYKKLVWGGTAGTGPSNVIPEAALDWNFQSPGNISASVATPYKLQVQIPVAVVTLGAPRASGADLIYFEVDYAMTDLDPAKDPITVTLTNLTQHYAGT